MLSNYSTLDNSEGNIDLNARDNGGWNAFISACYRGHTDVVQLLLDNSERNIDMNARINAGWTAFLYACSYGRKDVVKLLVEHSKTKEIEFFNWT